MTENHTTPTDDDPDAQDDDHGDTQDDERVDTQDDERVEREDDERVGDDDHSNTGERHTTSRADSISPLLVKASVLSGRFLWVGARAAVMGLVLVVAFLTDTDRRIRVRRWFLLEGNRWTIIAGMVGSVFVGALVLSLAGVIGVANAGFVTTVFGSIISGLFSFVPIVVAVNQLTVSQLVGTPGKLREQIKSVTELRTEIADMIDDRSVTSTEPAAFLDTLADALDERTTALRQAAADNDPVVADRLHEFADLIDDQMDAIDSQLAEPDMRLIDVLIPMMGQGYSANIHTTRKLQTEYADVLSDSEKQLLDDIRELFVSMDVVRQYFKGLDIKQELPTVSRLIGYTGIASFLVSSFLVLLFATGHPLTGHPVVMDVFVSASFAVAFAPFAVLLAFVVRIATIAKRTAAPGAFTPRRETPEYRRRSHEPVVSGDADECYCRSERRENR